MRSCVHCRRIADAGDQGSHCRHCGAPLPADPLGAPREIDLTERAWRPPGYADQAPRRPSGPRANTYVQWQTAHAARSAVHRSTTDTMVEHPRRLTGWAIAAGIGFGSVALAAARYGWTLLAERDALRAGASTFARDAAAGDVAVALGTHMLLMLATLVPFLVWFYIAYDNIARSRRRFGVGWAIGAWFVPVLNLWRPKQVANDVWTQTAKTGTMLPIQLWWGSFLGAYTLITIAGAFAAAGELADQRTANALAIGAAVCMVVYAVAAIAMIVQVTRGQHRTAAGEAQRREAARTINLARIEATRERALAIASFPAAI